MSEFYDAIKADLDALDWGHRIGVDFGAAFGADYSSDSSTVAALQSAVNALGYQPALTVDGRWGPASIAGLKWAQAQKGLTADGVPGDQTLAAFGVKAPAGGGGSPAASSGGPQQLPDKSTPMTADDVTKALAAGYRKVVGKSPSPDVLKLILAQSGFETGGWGKGIHNYNFGNAKATAHDQYYQVFTATEGQGDNVVSQAMKFVAFKNPEDAGVHQIKLLKARSNWWDGLQTGTVEGFVRGLTTPPMYFTGNADQYTAGLNRYVKQYGPLAEKYAGYVGLGFLGLIGYWFAGGFVVVLGVLGYRFYQTHAAPRALPPRRAS